MWRLRQPACRTARGAYRIKDRDVIGLQAKAAEEGIPYQTLISSVLHKFLTGTLWATETGRPNKASHRTTNPRRVGVR